MTWSSSLSSDASPLETRWLTATGALTGHMAALGRVGLRVLSETIGIAHDDEATGPARLERGRYFIREVLISIDATPSVAARSLIPDADGGTWAAAKTLRTTPLAHILYAPGTTRTDFAFTRLGGGQPLFDVARPFLRITGPCLARRSIFTKAAQSILVSECFLPGFWPLAAAGLPRAS